MPKYNSNKKGGSSDNPHRVAANTNQRSKSTIMRLNMYKRGKAVRNKEGKVIGGTLMMNDRSGGKEVESMARIAPNRRWFGNTRTIGQSELDRFREEVCSYSNYLFFPQYEIRFNFFFLSITLSSLDDT